MIEYFCLATDANAAIEISEKWKRGKDAIMQSPYHSKPETLNAYFEQPAPMQRHYLPFRVAVHQDTRTAECLLHPG